MDKGNDGDRKTMREEGKLRKQGFVLAISPDLRYNTIERISKDFGQGGANRWAVI